MECLSLSLTKIGWRHGDRYTIREEARIGPILRSNHVESSHATGPYGSLAKTSDPTEPGVGDDAAADAGHQAAAALQSRPGCLCRGRAGAEPVARPRRRVRAGRRAFLGSAGDGR